MVIYTLQSILIFAKRSEEAREFLFIRQNVVMFCLHFVAFMVLYLQMNQSQILFFYGEQALYLAATLIFFRHLYPKASKLAINNMCMLITIGFIMVTRLSYDQSVKQFQICVIGTVIALIVPWLISKLKFITKFAVVYAILGIGLLVAVAVMATVTNGAKLSLTIAGITLQPSEFVKIIYVFCIAGMLSKSTEFSQIVKTTILAAVHVLILVISTDLVHHDMNAVAFGYPVGQIPQMDTFSFKADEKLAELAEKACHEVNPEIQVFRGRIVSGDQFIADKAVKNRITENFQGYCTEMEGAAIAQAAYLNDVPFVVLRAISDKADDSASMDYPTFEAQAAEHCVKLVEHFLELI